MVLNPRAHREVHTLTQNPRYAKIHTRRNPRFQMFQVGAIEPVCTVQIGSERQQQKEIMKNFASFFSRLRQKFFKWRVNLEIHDRIFPHLEKEKDYGYPFITDKEMNAQTKELDVQPLLDTIEGHIKNMPKAYGESFRHIMHRDLHERFRMYEQLARRSVQPKTCDPRFIAVRA